MQLIVLQGIFLVVIFVVTLISLLVPVWIFPRDPAKQVSLNSGPLQSHSNLSLRTSHSVGNVAPAANRLSHLGY